MSDSSPRETMLADLPAEQAGDYREICGLAVVGLLLGLAAPLALAGPILLAVPLAGLVINLLALRKIAVFSPALLGRTAAQLGLGLSLVFGIAGPTHVFSREADLSYQARAFASEWFEYLRNDEPHKAYQLLLDVVHRRELDEKLWEHYRLTPAHTFGMRKFVEDPIVRILLHNGRDVEVRFVDRTRRGGGSLPDGRYTDVVADRYVLTLDRDGRRTSAYFYIILNRIYDPVLRRTDWYVAAVTGNKEGNEFLRSL